MKKYEIITAAVVLLVVAFFPDQVEAARQGASGGLRLIKLMQKGTFWLGMAVCIWGIIEMQLDLPGWSSRIMRGVLGYIAILLIPLIFLELESSMAVDVWEQIENGR